MSPRWMKLLRDARLARARMLMIVLALAVSIAALLIMLSAYVVLAREVPRNYNGSNPASAQLELGSVVDADTLAKIASQPNIAAAELAAVTSARVEVAPGKWLPMRIFVIADFARQRINTLGPEAGSWPPLPGTLLIERSALAMSGAAVGRFMSVEFSGAGRHSIELGGVVHDPGLAPAWQEGVIYAYATPQTLARFGVDVPLDLLKIVVSRDAHDSAVIESTARALALWLGGRGVPVHEVRIPPPMQHPHQSQMNTVLMMLLLFSLLVLLLGGVLTAAIIGGLLSQQVRQIAIMKSIGAGSQQLAGLYLGLVGALAGVALVVAVPLGVIGARALVGKVAGLLNLRIDSMALPWALYAATVVLGLAVPLLAALAPVILATRGTVQAAMQDANVSRAAPGTVARWLTGVILRDPAFTLALRNLFRRRARFMLTMLLLAGAGAMFLTSMNLRAAWEDTVAQAAADRRFDLELRLQDSMPAERVMALINRVAAVRQAEGWSIATAALAGEGGMKVSRRYPDGGHGSLALRAAPPDTALVARAMLAGRWLQDGDSARAVVNGQALASAFPGAKVGSTIALMVGDRTRMFEVVGVVRDILAPATVYIVPGAFAAATGSEGRVNAVRIALVGKGQAASAGTLIAAALAQDGIGIKATLTEKTFAAGQGAHIYILVWALGFIAAVMAVVALLGLASSLGTSVIERTHEFGVMRALGAPSGAVVRSVLYEGVLTGLASVLIALPAAALPSALVGAMMASISSQALSLQLSPGGAALWLGGVLAAALAVSYFPATRASNLTIKQTLDWEYA